MEQVDARKSGKIDHQHLEPALVEANNHRGKQHGGEQNHQRIGNIRGQVEKGFGLHVPGNIGSKNFGKNFLGGLHQAFGPSGLLRFETVHVHGKLGWAFDFGEIEKFPAFKLSAIGKVGVFGERVMLPATGGIDGGRGARRRRCH